MTTLHPRLGAGLWLIPASATIVHLRGELDLATREAVRERLLRTLQHDTGLLILDLSGVSFCDAAGLSALVGVQRQARSLDIALALAAPRPRVAKVLRLTGLDRSFPMYGTTPGTGTGEVRDRAGSGPAAAR
ncbi:STAS domain-containing protein [Nonomuraea sp. NEAU-A123]|uniref:STAS domain-containing protein n=1 Tax=Nonomuraea sp. NEAU-A123 TaxID=2839649 RepID=UPI001BE4B61A|nr:STAS domain-containing protein [Nonomuraea sp. NEAU-A123]MBT2235822.1 STAS domain-containing protein [Nonomuraea sp. NEAU-A123]